MHPLGQGPVVGYVKQYAKVVGIPEAEGSALSAQAQDHRSRCEVVFLLYLSLFVSSFFIIHATFLYGQLYNLVVLQVYTRT